MMDPVLVDVRGQSMCTKRPWRIARHIQRLSRRMVVADDLTTLQSWGRRDRKGMKKWGEMRCQMER